MYSYINDDNPEQRKNSNHRYMQKFETPWSVYVLIFYRGLFTAQLLLFPYINIFEKIKHMWSVQNFQHIFPIPNLRAVASLVKLR